MALVFFLKCILVTVITGLSFGIIMGLIALIANWIIEKLFTKGRRGKHDDCS